MDTPRSRRALTLVELVLTLGLLGVLLGLAASRARQGVARSRLSAARRELVAAFAEARSLALARGSSAVLLDSARALVVVRVEGDTTSRWPVGSRWGVEIHPSRDSMAYDARGLGRGAANLRIVLALGAAAETVVVSRLGRVR